MIEATICIPRAHAHALWLLPWVERLLCGATLSEVLAAPPWPRPTEPALTRQLVRTLIDLRWVVPNWSGAEVFVAPELADRFQTAGRVGLARALFDADVLPGEWWADAIGGTILSRQTAIQFDWDLRRKADQVLEPVPDSRALLARSEPDLWDLIRKLGGVDDVWRARDRAFLGTPLAVGARKDILFSMVGADVRLLPDELSDLEPALLQEAPWLFGQPSSSRSRVVHLARSPVEQVAVEVERLPVDPVALAPMSEVRARCHRLRELVRRLGPELSTWLSECQTVRSVCGPTQRHFDALAEMCEALPEQASSNVLLTSAFLNEEWLDEPHGLASALEVAPPDTKFVLVHGHASDVPPALQARDMARFTARLANAAPRVAARLVIVAGKRRSHEKVVVTSAGHWLVGSWNPASSRPGALVFECSLAGLDPRFACALVDIVGTNVEEPEATERIGELRRTLEAAPAGKRSVEALVATLTRAVTLLADAVPADDGSRASAWPAALRAVRGALQPFMAATKVELIDEHQTRDAFVAHARTARRSVLVASDRLAHSALDSATLRDLGGVGRSRRVVRVVWGREWAGRRLGNDKSKEQIQRAKRIIQEARMQLGSSLLVSDEPMENHAKGLVVDGLRGIVTSENLLSYGGEKGRHESRELGVVFWGPALARDLLGRFLHHWPDPLVNGGASPDAMLAWIAAGNEAWHAVQSVGDELDFDWRAPAYIGEVVRDELREGSPDDGQQGTRRATMDELERRVGPRPFIWLRDQAERLGLAQPNEGELWLPYDAAQGEDTASALELARSEIERLPLPVAIEVAGDGKTEGAVHPVIQGIMTDMVRVATGRFRMGDDRVPRERPCHEVVLSRPFLMGRAPVTQGLWKDVMGCLPHLRDGERHPDKPIIWIGREDIENFLARLNALPGGGSFELPTEAQWEYACRAGSSHVYCFGDRAGVGNGPGVLERYAWTKRNSNRRLPNVGLLEPNAWGLYDMHGLVYETMRDGFRAYGRVQVVDPVGPLDDGRIVARGGCWSRFPVDERRPENEHFRCASRQVFEKGPRCSIRLVRQEDEP